MRHHEGRRPPPSDDALQGPSAATKQVPATLTISRGQLIRLEGVARVRLAVSFLRYIEGESCQGAFVALHPVGVLLDRNAKHLTDNLRTFGGANEGTGYDQVEGDARALPLLGTRPHLRASNVGERRVVPLPSCTISSSARERPCRIRVICMVLSNSGAPTCWNRWIQWENCLMWGSGGTLSLSGSTRACCIA